MTFTLGRRSLATMLVTGVATLGVTSAAHATDTTTPPAKPTTSQHTGLLGGGLFKTVFGIFGAVREQTPTIAAPIIADAVTAKKITQAQADELTALFSGKLAKPAAPTPTTTTTTKMAGSGQHNHVKLAPEQVAVLRDVMQAIAAKLPEIAKPVIDAAVAAGDITQKQADLITKVIAMVANFKPGSIGLKPATAAGTPTTVKPPIASLQQHVTKKVRKAAKRASKRSHKTRRAAH